MNRAFRVWIWSLGVVARSYWTVMVLAALIALWVLAASEWLGLAESSALLLILTLICAFGQFLAAAVIVGGTVAGALEAAATAGRSFPALSIWTLGRKKVVPVVICSVASLVFVWLCSAAFDWINGHSVEVASFLTFHSQKPVSHVFIEKIYSVIEMLWWVVFSGFLLSFLIARLRAGWREAAKQTWRLLGACAFRTPFLTSLLSLAVFGGMAYQIAIWHPLVPPGFWDYTQMMVRMTLALIFISAGVLFWSLSLARLQVPQPESPQAG